MEKQKILIAGGNGFVGHNICKLASERNIAVVSISRSGKPVGIDESQYQHVEWIAADIFDPSSWKDHLEQCTAVIHSIGIIEEQPEQGITYDRVIYQSAKVTADAAKEAGVPRFIYISAGGAGPDTPKGYMLAKEKAEAYIATMGLDVVILKPGMIYGEEQPETMEENAKIQQLLADPKIGPHIRPHCPLHVSVIAKAVVTSILDNNISGKLNVDAIERIGG